MNKQISWDTPTTQAATRQARTEAQGEAIEQVKADAYHDLIIGTDPEQVSEVLCERLCDPREAMKLLEGIRQGDTAQLAEWLHQAAHEYSENIDAENILRRQRTLDEEDRSEARTFGWGSFG